MRQLMLSAVMVGIFATTNAQTPMDRSFGFGIILGDPTGLTAKFESGQKSDIALSVGNSYFGSPRFGLDYTWRIYSFHDAPVHLYAGPGAVIGFGSGNGWFYSNANGRFYYRPAGDFGLGIRGVFGTNIDLKHDPIEFFCELGPMIGISPSFGSTVELGLGVRFYP